MATRGDSFHFAHRFKDESLKESIRRHEYFLALKLGLNKTHKVGARDAASHSDMPKHLLCI